MITITQFRPIEGFEELYEIDNDGNVKNVKSNKIKKNCIMPNGYCHIALWKNNKQYHKYIHRLVAEAFLPNENNLPSVNHKDENKQNNHVEIIAIDSDGNAVIDYEKSNLEWCTVQYNNSYGTRIERIISKNRGKSLSEEHKAKIRNHKSMSKQVVVIDKYENILEFDSTREVERQLGIKHENVSACCLGKQKTCFGYRCYFKSDWEQMQKNKAKPVKRELPYQLSLQF